MFRNALLAAIALSVAITPAMAANPFAQRSTLPYEAPPFDRIQDADYQPAIEAGIALNWVGSHVACTMSADGRYLVTGLQETGLHAWQLPELRDMRMSGYAAKTRSFSWDRRGKWLATSGDARAILWPFEGKTGPMGKAPLLLAERKGALVTRVAFHPRDDFLAVGYSDGAVVFARVDDRIVPIDEGGAFVTALAWNDAGTRLGWGGEDGRVGVLDMEARA